MSAAVDILNALSFRMPKRPQLTAVQLAWEQSTTSHVNFTLGAYQVCSRGSNIPLFHQPQSSTPQPQAAKGNSA